MKRSTPLKIASLAAMGILVAACKQPAEEKKEAAKLDLNNEVAKISYAIGASAGSAMQRNLATLDGTSIEIDVEVLAQAFAESVKGSSQLDEKQMQEVMNGFRTQVNAAMQEKRKKEQEEQQKIAEENKTKGAAFLEENKAKEGVKVTDSGLQYKVITEGNGKSPATTDRVKVHYKGTLIDGSEFDSSYSRNQPATFGLTQVIKGWTEGLQLMKEGSKWQFFIPSELAYGEPSRPKIPGNSVLIFEVELIEVIQPEKPKAEAKPAEEKK